eukprot:gene15106-biopygen23164
MSCSSPAPFAPSRAPPPPGESKNARCPVLLAPRRARGIRAELLLEGARGDGRGRARGAGRRLLSGVLQQRRHLQSVHRTYSVAAPPPPLHSHSTRWDRSGRRMQARICWGERQRTRTGRGAHGRVRRNGRGPDAGVAVSPWRPPSGHPGWGETTSP